MANNNNKCDDPNPTLHLLLLPSFPSEILVRIFAHLNQRDLAARVSLVCRRFRHLVAQTPSLWANLEVPPPPPKQYYIKGGRDGGLGHEAAVHLIRWASTHLKSISLGYRGEDGAVLATVALRCCGKLEDIQGLCQPFDGENSFGQFLQAVSDSSSVRSVEFETLWDADVLASQAVCLKNLTSVSIQGVIGGSRNLLEEIGKHCASLAHFRGRGFDDVELDALLRSVRNRIKTLSLSANYLQHTLDNIGRCRSLQRLELKNSDVTNVALRRVTELLCLEELSVVGSGNLSGLAVSFTGRKMVSLTRLTFHDCPYLGPGSLVAIAESCPSLVVLLVTQCRWIGVVDDEGVGLVMMRCVGLEELKLLGVGVGTVSGKAFVGPLPPFLKRVELESSVVVTRKERERIERVLLASGVRVVWSEWGW